MHVSNAAPKSEARRDGGYGREGRGSGGRENRVGRGDNGPDGPAGGMYQQRYNGPGSGGPNQGGWGSQGGPRGNIDMPNLQALGKLFAYS